VDYALYYYILPKIANFGTEDNAERAKIGYYQIKYDSMFAELITGEPEVKKAIIYIPLSDSV